MKNKPLTITVLDLGQTVEIAVGGKSLSVSLVDDNGKLKLDSEVPKINYLRTAIRGAANLDAGELGDWLERQ